MSMFTVPLRNLFLNFTPGKMNKVLPSVIFVSLLISSASCGQMQKKEIGIVANEN
jgi:hypothetical protein